MKVCFDTCTVIDILGKTDWFFDAYCAYDVALLNEFEVCLSVSSTPDVVYLLHSRGLANNKEARSSAKILGELFSLMDNIAADVNAAAQSDMADFEDALIAYAAKRNDVDLIVTRNLKDFVKSPVPAMSPENFVSVYKPAGVEYSLEDF